MRRALSKKCANCEQNFRPPQGRKFCSHACYSASLRGATRGGVVSLRCEGCGVEFETKRSHTTARTYKAARRFCSPRCAVAPRAEETTKHKPRPCSYCRETFKPRRASRFCSAPCRDAARRAASVAALEARIGEGLGAYFARRIAGRATVTQMCAELGVSYDGFRTLKKTFGFETIPREVHALEALRELLANRQPTSIERKMMDALSAAGLTFEYQYGIEDSRGNLQFICDFAFPGARLIVECDGDYWHALEDNKRRDRRKNAYLKACGFTVLRFPESRINRNVAGCVRSIRSRLLPA